VLALKELAGARAKLCGVERGAIVGVDSRYRLVRRQRHALARKPEQRGRTRREGERAGNGVEVPETEARGVFDQGELRRLVGEVLPELLWLFRRARLRPRPSE